MAGGTRPSHLFGGNHPSALSLAALGPGSAPDKSTTTWDPLGPEWPLGAEDDVQPRAHAAPQSPTLHLRSPRGLAWQVCSSGLCGNHLDALARCAQNGCPAFSIPPAPRWPQTLSGLQPSTSCPSRGRCAEVRPVSSGTNSRSEGMLIVAHSGRREGVSPSATKQAFARSSTPVLRRVSARWAAGCTVQTRTRPGTTRRAPTPYTWACGNS